MPDHFNTLSAAPKRPLKVFLCHASADKPKVRELYRTLKRRGVQPWLDAEDLIPGQNWEMEIPKALLSSDAIIICLTPNSVDKEGYVQKEIKFALDKAMEMPEGRIFIIPARLEDCELPFSLRQYQAVNLYEKVGYTKLMQALKLRASQLERAIVELPKAGETTAEIKKVVEEKKPPEPKEEKPEIKTPKPSREKVGVGGDVRDSVIVAGSGNVINIGDQKKSAPEQPKPEKPQPKKAKSPRKPNTAIIVAVIGLAGTIIAALLGSPIIERWLSPAPSATETATVTATFPTSTQTTPPVVSVTPTETVALNDTPAQSFTITPVSLLTESPVANTTPLNNSRKLYFVGNGYLSMMDVDSRQVEQLSGAEGFYQHTMFWLNDSEIAIWSGGDIAVTNVESAATRIIDGSDYRLVDTVSDVSSEGRVIVGHYESFSVASFDDEGNLNPPLDLGLNTSDYRYPFCMRWRPDASMIALVFAELEGYSINLPPNLVILRIGPGEKPVIIKKRIDGCVSWSPDGRFILYGNKNPNRTKYYEFHSINLDKGIYYIDIISGSVNKLSDTDGYYPVWSPDGNAIAFITENGISLIDVATKEENQIYSGEVLALLWGR